MPTYENALKKILNIYSVSDIDLYLTKSGTDFLGPLPETSLAFYSMISRCL
jgi:hypothetical protein